MFRTTLLIAGTCLLASGLVAAPRGEADAQRVAEYWLLGHGYQAELNRATPWTAEGHTCLYEFHFADGAFAFIAADDAAPPVLGWGPQGGSASDVPALQLWLEHQVEQIAQLQAAQIDSETNRSAWELLLQGGMSGTRSGVDPLVTARWSQGGQYNAAFPVDEDGPGGHVLVGCVAVAMGEIMSYWMQPVHGIGEHTYYHARYGEQHADFENTLYDWQAIHRQSFEEISRLLYHCAISVEMDFSSDESGALVYGSAPSAQAALMQHFNFRGTVAYSRRASHNTDRQWCNTLRGELDEGRPLLYRARRSDGIGHAFVCDGYSDEEYFHFNWGWAGNCDGYYLITQLNPAGMNFNNDEAVLLGIEPSNYHLPPEQFYPSQGDVDVPVAASFLWTAVEGATRYDVELDLSYAFDSPRQYNDVSDTSFVVDGLQHNTTYYWRVRAQGVYGISHWSLPCEFRTVCSDEIDAPDLVSPVDNTTLGDIHNYSLTWEPVDCAYHYELEVDDDVDFASPLHFIQGITLCHLQVQDSLEYNREYYWRVRAIGFAGESEWSDPFTFSTPIDDAVSVLVPLHFSLQACPNPFNPTTQLLVELDVSARTTVLVYNLSGQRVAVLHNGPLSAGQHRFQWTAADQASGLFLAVVESGNRRGVQKLTVLK